MINIIYSIINIIVTIIVIYLGARSYFTYLPIGGRSYVYQEIDWFIYTSFIWTGGFSVYCVICLIWEKMSAFTNSLCQTLILVICGWIITRLWTALKNSSRFHPLTDEEYYLISIVGLITATSIAAAQGITNLSSIIVFMLGCFFGPDTTSWDCKSRFKQFLINIKNRNLLIISIFSIIGFLFVILFSLLLLGHDTAFFSILGNWSYMTLACVYCIIETIVFSFIISDEKKTHFNKWLNSKIDSISKKEEVD